MEIQQAVSHVYIKNKSYSDGDFEDCPYNDFFQNGKIFTQRRFKNHEPGEQS
jgi:hypothetical protein